MTAPALTADELAMLRFAGEWWRNAAAKERAIAERFGLTPVRFYQRVNRLIDTPAALTAEPEVTNRLRRIRDTRRVGLGRLTPAAGGQR